MSLAMQSRFAAALINWDRPVPLGVTSWTQDRPAKRFGVYRNNVIAGLAEALAAGYPATVHIVGEEFFAAMARVFVRCRPPTSPSLLTYGDGFADFVEGFEPASELIYLPDVIRLEDARARAYHAADIAPLAPRDIAAVPPKRLGGLVVEIHPSAAIVRSAFPIITIWAMNAGETELGPIDDRKGEDALVIRPNLRVLIHGTLAGGATFLERLSAGAPLRNAVEAAIREAPRFDLTANLSQILGAGVIVGIREQPLGEDG
jgi:hypothetical protein